MNGVIDLGEHRGLSVITLGVAAGPAIRGPENGMATAIVVDDAFYLVDFGIGCTRAAAEAGLVGDALRAGFITHLHSDHVAELPGYLLFNWGAPVQGIQRPIMIYGPASDRADADGPLAGTRDLVSGLLSAYSYDIDIRQVDEGRPPFTELLTVEELAPGDEAFDVYRDDRVRVRAVRVDHPPIEQAFAFRFDTDYGSVTLSGDTAFCQRLADLAQGSDLLVHEAVNLGYYEELGFAGAFLDHQRNSHSHPRDAGRIAQSAGVHHLILSHFAGRADTSWWRDMAAETFTGDISVASSGDVFTTAAASARHKGTLITGS